MKCKFDAFARLLIEKGLLTKAEYDKTTRKAEIDAKKDYSGFVHS